MSFNEYLTAIRIEVLGLLGAVRYAGALFERSEFAPA
jgi:hypothetical protein